MSPVKSELKNYKKFDTPMNVNLADESVVLSYGSGDVDMQLFDEYSDPVSVVIKDVLFVPKLQKKLLSITSMTKKDAAIQFGGKFCTLFMNEKKYLLGHQHGKLWKLNCPDVSCFNVSSNVSSLELWHLRLGHLNCKDVKLLFEKKMLIS